MAPVSTNVFRIVRYPNVPIRERKTSFTDLRLMNTPISGCSRYLAGW